jgi:hypothetical protein
MRCVPARDFTVSKAIAWRSSIDDDPPYQRGGAAWALERQQLFIDSLLNGYDVPKIYLHDLRGHNPTKVYAVVDGKQRLTTIWSFVADGFPLAPTFRIEAPDGVDRPDAWVAVPHPVAGQRFSELHPAWRTSLLGTPLAVVLIRTASEGDIEELFSRLNNGVPLSDAERRNALGGPIARLVRELAHRWGSAEGLHLLPEDGRREVAIRLLVLEDARRRGALASLDLSPAGLEAFVRLGRQAASADVASLADSVDRRLTGILGTRGLRDVDGSDPARIVSILRAAWEAPGDDPPAPADTRATVRTRD